MQQQPKRGKLFALEGIDNAGKTSHIERLKERFEAKGIRCQTTKELTSDIGKLTLQYLKAGGFSSHLKTLMFAADRQERVEREVEPALANGQIVLADRWILSAMVYRAVEGFDIQYVMAVNSLTLQPDFTFLIDIPVQESIDRESKSDKFNPYSHEFLGNARKRYLEISKQFPRVEIIDGTLPFDEINNILLAKIESLIAEQ